MKPKAIIVSGYFNPLHMGHLELFEKAKAAGDQLWVIVNNDLQRELKGSKEFMDQNERHIIISAIGIVDDALISIDKDKLQIGCSIKQLSPDPFEHISNYEIGKQYKVKVEKITDYGCFCSLEPGLSTLLHSSEISWTKKI